MSERRGAFILHQLALNKDCAFACEKKREAKMFAEAVVSFLIGKLGDLLVHHGSALLEVSGQVEWLKGELEWMQAFLKDADTKQNDARVKKWVADVRDISYKAEDAIDTFIFQIEQSRRRGSVSYLQNITSFVDERSARHQLGKKIEEIKNELSEIIRRRKTYGIISLSKGGEGSSSMGESLREQRRTSPLLQDTEIVGFQEDIITLVARLIEGESRRCVISVVGMGGLGKTTLARKVYNHDDVKKHFDCCAWIYVSQEYVTRDLLLNILTSLNISIKECRQMEAFRLKETVFENLKNKRYIVVVDDIWKTEAWDDLVAAFPDMNNGSRVILTTRNRDVALHADIQSRVHDLKLLKTDESWKLFCQKIFFEQDLERLGKEIVAKCHGLPLAVVVVGGLLSRKSRHPSQWENVLKSLCWPSVEGQVQISTILALSYDDLFYYLKPCFLYLGVYPEDHEFSAKELIRLWVAEGFVHSEGAKTSEEVGEDCLEELIQRSLIQIVERSSIGGIKSCSIHDLLRDLSLLTANKESFLNVDTRGASYLFLFKASQLAMHHGDSVNSPLNYYFRFPPNIRSIIWFSSEQYLRQEQPQLIFGGLQLLRVLHLSRGGIWIEAGQVPYEIGTLIHLRYLEMNVNGNETRRSLPSSMANLCNLQTLVIRTASGGPVHIPIDIWNMQQLRHVRVVDGAFTCEGSTLGEQTADELSLPSNLQTLTKIEAGNWIGNYLEKLINLRTLKIDKVDSSRHGEGLIDSIPKLDLLQSLKLTGEGLIPFPPILNLLHLFKLHLHGRLGNLPESHEFSPNLTKLTLYGSKLKQDPMMILEKLANLRVLRLEYASYLGKEMVCSRQGFPRLEFLVIRGLYGLEEWRVEEGAMPSLLRLQMYGSDKLKMLPEGLQHVTTLKKLETSNMSFCFTDRLQKDEGEDWYKIQHIPSIHIDPSY